MAEIFLYPCKPLDGICVRTSVEEAQCGMPPTFAEKETIAVFQQIGQKIPLARCNGCPVAVEYIVSNLKGTGPIHLTPGENPKTLTGTRSAGVRSMSISEGEIHTRNQ